MTSMRKPQINFQVDPSLKLLYDQAKGSGYRVTQLCAAGFLLMVENPQLRLLAINRLRDWLAQYGDADADEIRGFVQGARDAMQARAPETPKARKAPRRKKAAKRA